MSVLSCRLSGFAYECNNGSPVMRRDIFPLPFVRGFPPFPATVFLMRRGEYEPSTCVELPRIPMAPTPLALFDQGRAEKAPLHVVGIANPKNAILARLTHAASRVLN